MYSSSEIFFPFKIFKSRFSRYAKTISAFLAGGRDETARCQHLMPLANVIYRFIVYLDTLWSGSFYFFLVTFAFASYRFDITCTLKSVSRHYNATILFVYKVRFDDINWLASHVFETCNQQKTNNLLWLIIRINYSLYMIVWSFLKNYL